MAKRFGRNQKRQLREQIAQLEQAHTLDRSLVSYQANKLSEYEYWARRLDHVVPKYSALRKDVEVVTRDRDPGDQEFLSNLTKLPPIGSVDYLAMEAPIERIRMNVVRVESQPEQFRHGLRYELRVGGGFGDNPRVMYALDDMMIREKDYDAHFEEFIGREVARGMVNHLKNG